MAYSDNDLSSIAVIGMAVRLPGARDLREYWANIAGGVSSIEPVADEDLRASGVDESVLSNSRYVKRASAIDGVEYFDAAFFDMLPSEAEITDPQHRLLLECAYTAIEHAGYNPFALSMPVGVYAGVGISDYLIANLRCSDFLSRHDGLPVLIGNDKSYACTRISHRLDLTGPCVAVDTACSTSLVAVHEACKALLLNECDMALAGGARVVVPHRRGYHYQPGGVLSPDGFCRPFDADANGTVQGSGAGMVLLKRLVDALEDGDCVHAIIRGSAVNNDGAHKIGYSAPGVGGQSRVIAQALMAANVPGDSIGYIEAHGTGTRLGDPIEIESLRKAHRGRQTPCAVGSVKGNLGHLDVAAGVAGLIKAILALEHGQLPPSINYSRANPDIDFEAGPFYVNTALCEWPRGAQPRRAGVSSFGIGGTNAHVIVEEADRSSRRLESDESPRVFCLSARSDEALRDMRDRFTSFIAETDADLADVAYTLSAGRPSLETRMAVVAGSRDELLAELTRRAESVGSRVDQPSRIAFLFTGQGAQYVGMCRAFYERYEPFRACFDEIEALMERYLPCPLRRIVWEDGPGRLLDETRYTQPALFAVEQSLANLWRSFGVVPTHVVGHSLGEVVAACYAGVFTLEDAVKLVCARGRCMHELGGTGAMMAVMSSEEEVARLLQHAGSDLEIAAINGPRHIVLSGTERSVRAFEDTLSAAGVAARRLKTSQAFHSRAMDRAKEELERELCGMTMSAPEIPLVSNVRPWASATEQFTPRYWAEQMRDPVRLLEGIRYAIDQGVDTFIEIGPSPTLSKLGRACETRRCNWLHSAEPDADSIRVLLGSVAKLYEIGVDVRVHGPESVESRRRVALPTYPFQGKRYWNVPDDAPQVTRLAATAPSPEQKDEADTDASPSRPDDVSASLSAFEQRVANIWSAVLAISPIRPDDDFYELGGHSLLIVQLHERIEEAFGISPPLNTLMENRTLRAFSAAIEHLTAGEQALPDELPVISADRDRLYEPFPLVELQQAYLLGRNPDFELGGYSTHLYFEARPKDLDYPRFRAAVNALVARHDMLRAVIHGDHEQRILRDVPELEVPYYDFSDDAEGIEGHLRAVRHEMSHQVLPADRWPLFDIRVTRVSGGECIVHFSLDMLMLDAMSNRLLLRDLELLYRGQDHSLPELPISFRDYVVARHRAKDSEAYAAARKYWLERLPDMPLAPELPVQEGRDDGPRRFSRRLQVIDERTTRRLKSKARGMGITPSVLLMTAYGTVLSYWSRRPAFTVSLSISDRLPVHECVNDLVGEFSSTNLLTMDFSDPVSFNERARRVQRQLWRDYEHRAFGGVEVLRELSRAHRGERTALMPVVFTSALPLKEQPAGLDREDPFIVVTEDDYAISQTPQVWLDHFATERLGRLVLTWDFVEGIFPDGMIDDMFAAYTDLVLSLAEDDAAWHRADRELLPASQRATREAVNHANDRTRAPETLVDLFVRSVSRRPDAPALVQDDFRLSYRELEAMCRRWAAKLLELGVEPGEPVAIVMEKGWEQIVAALAIEMAGAAYVPIDARLPAKRIADLLEISASRHALTQGRLLEALSWPEGVSPLPIREVEEDAAVPELETRCRPGDLAYVIFTSGSTGAPKGVMITHEAAVNTVLDVNERFGVTESDRVLALSSLSFDLSVYDIFGTLAAGGVVVVPTVEAVDARGLDAAMRRHNVTVINAVPALVQLIVDDVEAASERLPRSLRLVLMSGDWVPVGLPQRIWNLASGPIDVVSLGGATEASIWSIFHRVTEVKREWRSIPYGTPLTNQTFHVLRHDLAPSPDWVVGDLYIGGAGLAQGYWKDDEKTRASFIVHPGTGERLYRTGDIGRYLPDGSIEFLGREDFQVKINGFRVELGEIESHLSAQDGVKQALVTVKQDADGGKSLTAYLLGREGHDEDEGTFAARLERSCRESLPSYMVPKHFVRLASIPLTSNGKIDYRALPSPERSSSETAYQPPRTALEKFVVEFLEETLEVGPIGVRDDFFKLGGHSLIAARLVTKVRESFGASVPIRLVFDHPEIAALARSLDAAIGRDRALPALPAQDDSAEPVLSYAQQRLWFVHEFDKAVPAYASAYNMPLIWRIRGELDVEKLRLCLQAIVDEHAVLRTSFHSDNGKPFPRIREDAALPWAHFDLTGRDDAETVYRREVERIVDTPFDLSVAPLVRAAVFEHGPADFSLLINMHHIVTDAWSTGVLTEAIGALYNLPAGAARTVEAEPRQYHDYARWQRRVWEEGLMRRHEDYWLEKLADLPGPLDLLKGSKRKTEKSYLAEALPFSLDGGSAAELKEFSAANGLTPFTVLLATFKLLLHFYSEQSDLIVGTDTANRDPKETEGMLGYFINQVAIRTSITGQTTLDEVIRNEREAVLEAFEHQAMPLDRLIEKLRIPRDAGSSPLFQCKLNYHSVEDVRPRLHGLDVELEDVPRPAAHYDLVLTFKPLPDGMLGTLQYRKGAFPRAAMEQFVESFKHVLRQVIRRAAECVHELDYRAPALTAARSTPARRRYAGLGTLDAAFRRTADRYPSAVAVIDARGRMTYGELDAESNRLARALVAQGVKPGDRVGLFIERGRGQVISILAVLKVGAAYVPLDVRWPGERVRFVVRDVKPALVLTDGERRASEGWEPGGRAFEWVALAESVTDAGPLEAAHSADYPAYVMYTSGSTGRPKGVVITHANVRRLFSACRETYEFGNDDVWLLFHSYVFDVSVWEMWGAFMYGGRLVAISHEDVRSAARVAEVIGSEGVTVLNQTPSAFGNLLTLLGASEEHRSSVLGLRWIVFAGERLDPATLAAWYERNPDCRAQLVNMYGITETTVHSTLRLLTPEDARAAASPIGRALPDLEIHLLDRDMRPVPVGVTGEIYVGGDGVALGYCNDPARTAERMLPNPFSADSSRLYRSGDLARWVDDGELEYVGRSDHQIKIRGYRIELGEIESCLLEHEDVVRAVVRADDDGCGGVALTAFWQDYPGRSASEHDLRRWLRHRLPEYMLPSAFVRLDDFPLTTNGKVDRAKLPARPTSRNGKGSTGSAATPTQQVLAGVVRDLLHLDGVEIDQSFFEIGGHSLLAAQLQARVNESFAIDLPLKAVFDAGSIKELADEIDEAQCNASLAQLVVDESFSAEGKEEFRL